MTSAAPSSPSVSGHVLLVDDEPAYQRLGASFLRQLGYRVSVAGDVDSALQAFTDDRPHVVLLDLAMPPSMDPQAGLPMKVEGFDAKGALLERYAFSDVKAVEPQATTFDPEKGL